MKMYEMGRAVVELDHAFGLTATPTGEAWAELEVRAKLRERYIARSYSSLDRWDVFSSRVVQR